MDERYVHYNGKTFLVRNFGPITAVGIIQGTLGFFTSRAYVTLYHR